jgi:uncharacterized protein (DUF697 family)
VSPASTDAARVIRRAAFVAGGVAAVLSPVPFADEAALLPVYGWLTIEVARARGTRLASIPWRSVAKAAVLGLAVRAAVNAPLAAVPGASAAMNAATAVGLMHAFGAYVDRLCADPTAKLSVREILNAIRARARR